MSESEKIILEQVQQAIDNKQPLNIVGGKSKSFYGRGAHGSKLDVCFHAGVVSYEPSELVITAKAGTKIKDIQGLLAENKQMLGFEPPFCSDDSTLGGVVAAGLSGPRRAYSGAVRDFILGVKMINGEAQVMNFGGQVMKNVAGFDHSRLMAGSLGTLGVLLEISLRVMPTAETEATVSLDHPSSDESIKLLNQLASKPLPLSASAWENGQTRIRLSGTQSGVDAAVRQIGGDLDADAKHYWIEIANQQRQVFTQASMVYRASVPPATQSLGKDDEKIIEWNGAQRWLFDITNVDDLISQINAYGGSLTVFRGGNREGEIFAQLDPVLMRLHQNIKNAFDPDRIFNPGRMYKDI